MVGPGQSTAMPLTSFGTLDKGLNISEPRLSNIPTVVTDTCLLGGGKRLLQERLTGTQP